MAKLVTRYRYATDERTGKKTKTIIGYAAKFTDPARHPKRKTLTLRTTDRKAAEHKMLNLEREYAAGLWDPWTDSAAQKGMPLEKAQQAFLKERVARGIIENVTLTRYQSTFRTFNAMMPPGMLVSQVETRHVEPFVYNKDWQKRTVGTYASAMSAFFNWCLKERMTKRNPFSDLYIPKPLTRLPAFLTRGDYAALLRQIEAEGYRKRDGANKFEWISNAVQVAVGTGMRRGESISLRWSALDLENGFVHVRASKGFTPKGGKERSIPLTGDAKDVILTLNARRTSSADDYVLLGPRGKKIREDYVTERFKYFAEKVGLQEEIVFHSCRHTFASWLAQAGVDIFRIKELLGHASIQHTLIYTLLMPADTRFAMEKVFGSEERAASGDGALRPGEGAGDRRSSAVGLARQSACCIYVAGSGSSGHFRSILAATGIGKNADSGRREAFWPLPGGMVVIQSEKTAFPILRFLSLVDDTSEGTRQRHVAHVLRRVAPRSVSRRR